MLYNVPCFNPTEWLSNEALRSCGLAAQALSIQMHCLMRESEDYGYLTLPSPSDEPSHQTASAFLARIVGSSEKEVAELLTELEGAGVFSRTDEGLIYSHQMVQEAEELMEAREAEGLCPRCGCRHEEDPTS
jgi:hypothetical protein